MSSWASDNTSSITITDSWPWSWPQHVYPTTIYYSYPFTPTDCLGDVHVFPCPHCNRCKCGKATVKKDK